MAKIPLINVGTGYVENVIVAEYSDPPPSGYAFGPVGAEIGWYWDGEKYVDPNPPPPPPMPANTGAPHVDE